MKELHGQQLDEFRNASKKVWSHKLHNEFHNQVRLIERGKILSNAEEDAILKEPIFCINQNNGQWGSWNAKERILTLNEKLFVYFPWSAVVQVLKHEMAHQVVSENFKMDCCGIAHGEAWRKACGMLDVEPNVAVSYEFLQKYDVGDYDKISQRIQKLLALSESDYEDESHSAMTKAMELMQRYNIRMAKKDKSKILISRPIGILWKKMPNYLWSLMRTLQSHYNVKFIQAYTRISENGFSRKYHYMEIFGSPENLDVAEYTAYYLIREAENKWNDFKLSDKYVKGQHGKIQWQKNFMYGFANKLNKRHDKVTERFSREVGMKSLILANDKMLEEAYDKAYPNRRNISAFSSCRRSGEGGREAGYNTEVHGGIRGGVRACAGLIA